MLRTAPLIFTITACLVSLATWPVMADLIVTGVVYQNDVGEFGPQYDIGNSYDQSGLSQSYVSGATDFDLFVNSTGVTTSANSDDAWYGQNGATLPAILAFDLGDTYTVTQLAMWSWTAGEQNALDGFEVYVDDNPGFTSPDFGGSFTFIADPANDGTLSRPAQVFDISDLDGRYVQILMTTQDTPLVGMGEFAFGVAGQVPEPASAGALVLTLIAGLLRRNRR